MKRSVLPLILCALLCTCTSMSSPEHLDAIGVENGASVFDVQEKLAQESFTCHISGVHGENFDCSKMTPGYLGMATCVSHVEFQASGSNVVENLQVPNVACSGF